MMRRCRIAVFTAEKNHEPAGSLLPGLRGFANTHPDVLIRVFNCFGGETDSLRNRNEYEVYQLAELTGFDGALVDARRILLEEPLEKLRKQIHEAGIPAVFTDAPDQPENIPPETAVQAADWMLRLMRRIYEPEEYEGADLPLQIYRDTEPSASCTELYERQIQTLKRFFQLQARMAEELFDAGSLERLMIGVERNREIFDCDSYYLCINDYYYDSYDRAEWKSDSKTFGREMVLAAGGPHGHDGKRFIRERFPTRQLLPEALKEREPFLVIYPLHYSTYSIGFLALNGASGSDRLNLQESVIHFIEIAIDNVRRKRMLRKLNEALDDLYVHDGLTGLYNRFGLERYGKAAFKRALDEDGEAQVLFIDMDDMKEINDQWGHESGDEALRMVSGFLRQSFGEDDFLMRYGGDEFLIISGLDDENLEEKLQQDLKAFGLELRLPYSLEMSIGGARAVRGEETSLEACMREADRRMYENKRQRKKGR